MEIQQKAFAWSGLENVQLPATLRQIDEMAFAGCTHLVSVRLPKGLHTIGKECFSESAVLGITLPSTLQEIEEFEGDFLKWFEVIYVKITLSSTKSATSGSEENLRFSHLRRPSLGTCASSVSTRSGMSFFLLA